MPKDPENPYSSDIYDSEGVIISSAIFDNGLHEIPHAASKHGPIPIAPDSISAYDSESEEDKILREISKLPNPNALVPTKRQEELAGQFAESDRIYKQGLDNSEDLPLG